MKIDESVIAKVLDNKASPEEARKVAGWFATEEGNKYLSERFDWEIGMLSEEMPESIDPHSIPEVKMKVRFMNEIKCERGQRPVGRRGREYRLQHFQNNPREQRREVWL